MLYSCFCFFFFQAEDGIRDLVRSRGLGDVYKRQQGHAAQHPGERRVRGQHRPRALHGADGAHVRPIGCLLYTSDAADERSSVDLGGRRIIKKKNNDKCRGEVTPLQKKNTRQTYNIKT